MCIAKHFFCTALSTGSARRRSSSYESFHKLFRVHLGWLALVVKLALNFFPSLLGHVMWFLINLGHSFLIQLGLGSNFSKLVGFVAVEYYLLTDCPQHDVLRR